MKTQNWTAWTLAGWLISQLRRSFLVYLISASLFAIVTLAPGKLFHYFAVELPGISSSTGQENFIQAIILFGLLIAIGTAIGALIKVYFKEKFRLELESFLRFEVVKRLHSIPGAKLRSIQRGEWLTQVSADIRMAEEFLGVTVPDALYHLALAIGTCVFLAYYSGGIATVLLIGAVASALLYYLVQRKLTPVLKEMRSLHASVFQLLLENIEGWRAIRSFDVVHHELNRVGKKLDQFRSRGLVAARLIGSLLCTNELVTQSLIILCLLAAAWGTFSGRISPTEALVYPFYLGQFFFAIRGLIRGLSGVNRYHVHGNRLARMFEEENTKIKTVSTSSKSVYELVASSVSLPIQPSIYALKDISFSIRTGEINAFTGSSGAGKSTLLDALAGLRTFDGSISIVSSAQPKSWLAKGHNQLIPVSYCSYVEQNPYLFEATLRENLLLGRKGISDREIWRALDSIGLGELFRSRQGLDSFLSDQGNNLSEGQVYRVGVARAIIQHCPFLLLDEPFASLDTDSIDILVRALHELKTERGILVVTHQIPEAIKFDKIFSVVEPESDHATKAQLVSASEQHPRKNDGPFSGLRKAACQNQGETYHVQ